MGRLALTWLTAGWFFGGALALVLAGTLLAFGANRRGTRAFVLALVLWGVWDVALGMSSLLDGPAEDYWVRVEGHFALVQPLALLYFGLVWPKPLKAVPPRVLLVAVLAYGALCEALLVTRRDLFETASGDSGPLGLLWTLNFYLLAIPALRWFRDFAQNGGEDGTGPAVLLAIGYGSYMGAARVGQMIRYSVDPQRAFSGHGETWIALADLAISLAALAAFVASIVVVARATHPDARRLRPRILGAMGLFVAAAVGASILRLLGADDSLSGYYDVASDVAITSLVTYALLKLRLFDLDLKVKWTISRGTLVAAFLATFFVAAELAQNFFSARFADYGWAFGGIAAGLLLFAIRPLERVAQRVADAAMPGVVDSRAAGTVAAKEDAYRAAVEMALADGVVNRHEERALAKLAHELGVTGPRALELREEVEARLGLGA